MSGAGMGGAAGRDSAVTLELPGMREPAPAARQETVATRGALRAGVRRAGLEAEGRGVGEQPEAAEAAGSESQREPEVVAEPE